jgi:D-beta-D-heptose 7-phosphate kinase/D-beta-D-heptose 1-phosphate adenosyltransferase
MPLDPPARDGHAVNPHRAAEKLVPAGRGAEMLTRWRARGETIAFATGAFDLLEVAHVRALATAKAHAAWLVVAVRGDASAASVLGAGRPALPLRDRAALVGALRIVDLLVVCDEDDPARLIERLVPGIGAGAARPWIDVDAARASPDLAGAAPQSPAAGRGALPDLVARVRARRPEG